MAGKLGKSGFRKQRGGGEIQQPRGDHASAPPDFGDVREIEIILIVFGVAQRRGLGVDCVILLADIGGAQDSHALGVGSHNPVLDSVVHHLHKVSRAAGPAMKVSLLGGATDFVASGSARYVANAGRQSSQDRIEALHHFWFAANHHAVTALEAPYAAASAYVHVVNFFRGQFLGAPDVVDVIGIAAVDQNISGLQIRQKAGDGLVHNCSGDHQPDSSRLLQLIGKVLERRGSNRLILDQLVYYFWRPVENDTLVATLD